MAKGITLQELDSSATSRLVIKDSAGRAKVTAPSAADDIALKSTVDNAVGNLSTLQTTDKSNVVKAINELFTNVSNGKSSIAAAIADKGVQASGSDTFAQLASKIGQIVTGKKFASGTVISIDEEVEYRGLGGFYTKSYEAVIQNLGFNPGLTMLRYYSPGNITLVCVTLVSPFKLAETSSAARVITARVYDHNDGFAHPSAQGFMLRHTPNAAISFPVPVEVPGQYEYLILEA
ncbi:hypothetical protein M3201_13535 [Paenibacillus motobuensis]|uniref:hypothetical protein n=1 Tax=Paenibacillus TaxID=44249 RepID=UPI0020414AA5|nr:MULTISPECIES: hypothetical protein [Paenibacillus]MCM3040720.1 hypothetical protein [Paenibacillus lutimineralis]MCM3647824.1 hypothetical protein [Paenibacillus motobuensis]